MHRLVFMNARRLVLIAIAALLAAGAAGLTGSARGDPAPNAAVQWNEIASAAIISTAGQPPHAAVLSLAMVQGAVYDAANAVDGGHQPYLVAPAATPGASKDAAVATAAFR